jgi:hypothetical protein
VTRRSHRLLLSLLAGAVLVAGCGGSSATLLTSGSATTPTSSSVTSNSVPGVTTSATSASRTSAGATTTSATSTGTGGATGSQRPGGSPSASPDAPGSLAAAIGICKREVASAPSLTAAERSQLVNLCTLAGEGNRAKLRAAERRVCLTVISDSAPGVTGPAITAARESCNRF